MKHGVDVEMANVAWFFYLMRHYAGYESILYCRLGVTIHLHALALGVYLLVDHPYRFLTLDNEE